MSPDKPEVEDLLAALRAGRSITTLPDGTIEIGPEEPIDPEEQARVDRFIAWLDAGQPGELMSWLAESADDDPTGA